jgi:Prokaryotic lipoprotein-attachment site
MVFEIGKFMGRTASRQGAPMWAPYPRAATRGRPYGAVLAFMIVALALSLAACGKKGPPEPPDPQNDKFPRQYPDPSSL